MKMKKTKERKTKSQIKSDKCGKICLNQAIRRCDLFTVIWYFGIYMVSNNTKCVCVYLVIRFRTHISKCASQLFKQTNIFSTNSNANECRVSE